jgi:hypothetical protein
MLSVEKQSWRAAFLFLNSTVIFTISKQISEISLTNSLRHGNQAPRVWGWAEGLDGVFSKVSLSARAPPLLLPGRVRAKS